MPRKVEQLRAKSEKELQDELLRCGEELSKLRFDRAFNKLKNVNALSQVKKRRAQILTLLREKQNVS